MAFEDFDARFGVEVPETDGAVVRGGEDGARGRVDFDGVDPVGVAAEDKGRLVFEVPDFDGLIPGAGDEDGGVKMQGYDPIAVAIVCRDAFSRTPVPDFDRVVETAADELGVIELKAPDAARVSLERPKLLSSGDVPDLNGGVIRSAGKKMVVKL